MDPEDDTRLATERWRGHLSRALVASAVAFALAMAFMRYTHPYLFVRHPDQMFGRCGIAALVTFAVAVFAARVREAGRE